MRDLLFSSTNMAAMTSRENHLLICTGMFVKASLTRSLCKTNLYMQPLAQLVEHWGCHAGGREFDSGRTNTQGLKITEEKVLPLPNFIRKMVRLSILLG